MNPHNQKPELSNSSLNSFVFFFNQRIIALEDISAKNMMLSKQFQIRQMRDLVEKFIKFHPYAYYNIVAMDGNRDPNWPVDGIKVRNFELFMDETPRTYEIAIHPEWEKADFYLLSPTGKRIKELWP